MCGGQLTKHELKESNLTLTKFLSERELSEVCASAISAFDKKDAGAGDLPRKQVCSVDVCQQWACQSGIECVASEWLVGR